MALAGRQRMRPLQRKQGDGGDSDGKMSATISVVIPTRNRPERGIRAVRSALDQSLPPHDVVVVVDGPDSATVRAVEDIGDSRVTIIELAENGGAARARNIGVSN